jgi:hypothetical protein
VHITSRNRDPTLEEIEHRAFKELREILTPPAVVLIRYWAFDCCSQLTTVILGEGLVKIKERALAGTPLRRIVLPPAVEEIDDRAFEDCSELTNVR